MIRSRVARAWLSSALALSAVLVACSSSTKSNGFADGGEGQGDDTSDDTGGGFGADDDSTAADDDPGLRDAGSISTPVQLDGGCASSTSRGQSQQLDIYIMLDQSGSMDQSGKWDAVTKAINSFVNEPTLAGVGVGIQYFGLPPGGQKPAPQCPTACTQNTDCPGGFCLNNTCICIDLTKFVDSCDAADYAKPEIEIAPLPGVAAKITSSMAAHQPISSTPTSAALTGAVQHASTWAKAHKGHTTIVLLATDGEPSGCGDINDVNAAAAAGFAGSPSIRTYVVGVGSDLTNLNGIASAGGTGSAFIVNAGNSNTQQQFLDALEKIRGSALGCQYKIPAPEAGTVNFNQVNVQYDPGNGKLVAMPRAKSAKSCPSSGQAWYYDDPSNPTTIILCPSTCSSVTKVTTASLSIVTGCDTVVVN